MNPIAMIPDPERGCGRLKPGGCYLQADRRAGGALEGAVWLLDWCRTDPPTTQFTVKVPPRAMMSIDPLASLLVRSLIPAGNMAGSLPLADNQEHLNILGRFGLADHVGESFYTPWSFFQELQAHGPSRRVPPAVAREAAEHLPCVVFFFMPVPILGDSIDVDAWITRRGLGLKDRDEDGKATVSPTWKNEKWTFLRRDCDGGPLNRDAYYGADHFEVDVLKEADLWAQQTKADRPEFPIACVPGVEMPPAQWVEMPFALSQFTRAVYVLPAGEEDLPDELQGSGVLPARLAGEESDE